MRIAALGLLLVLSAAVAGQTPALKLYTPKNSGLPQVQVMNLRQAPDGALWVCTYGGIGRFNGRRFTNYSVRNGLNSNITFDVAFLNDTVWLLTRDGLDVLVNGRLSNYLMAGEYKFYSGRLHLFGDSTRIVYNISTIGLEKENQRLLVFNLRNRKFLKTITVSNRLCDLQEFTFPVGNTLYYSADSLLVSFSAEETRARLLRRFDGYLSAVISSGFNRFLCLLADDTPFFHYDSVVHVQINPTGVAFDIKKFNSPENLKKEQGFLRPFFVNGRLMVFDNIGQLWDCTNDPPAIMVSNVSQINEVFASPQTFWIASEKGLVRLNGSGFKYYNPSDGFPENVWSVLPLSNNEVLFGTFIDGLQVFDSTRMVCRILSFTGRDQNISLPYYNGALKGFNNDVVLPHGYGIASYDCQTRRLTNIDAHLDKTTLTLHRDDARKLILAGNMHHLVAMDRQYKTEILLDLIALGHHATILAIEPCGTGYLLGLNRGIASYDTISRQGRIVTTANIRVNDLITDSTGTIWAATSQGLMQFVGDSLVPVFAGAIAQDVLTLAISNDGRLFIGGSTLLFTLDLKKYHMGMPHQLLAYGETAGYLGGEPGQNSFYKDERGWLWLPTSDNVVRINPAEIPRPARLPRATMVGGFALNQSLADTLRFFPADTNITVDYSHNNLHFEFEAVELDFPEALRFQYSIEGLSDRWFDLPDETRLETGSLWPGTYTLRVRATISETFEGVPEAVITLKVAAPFWLTWWFAALMGVLLLAALWMVVRHFIRREKQRAQQQMELYRLRAQALGTQMDNHFLVNCTTKIALFNQLGRTTLAAEYAMHFVRFLQRNLRSLRQETIALTDELEMLKAYAALENNDLHPFILQIEVAETIDLQQIHIPTFLLQPIVENAIRHGIRNRQEPGGMITIGISKLNHQLVVEIADNGPGFSGQSEGNHVSMSIVADRLALLGKGSRMEYQNLRHGYSVKLFFSIF